MTIGFTAVPSLAAGKVDAATGFWNSEGVALRQQRIPIRVFKVDEFGAPPYPELVLTTSRQLIESDPDLVDAVVAATRRGYAFAIRIPNAALDDLLAADPIARPRRSAGPAERPAPDPPPTTVQSSRPQGLGGLGPGTRACWKSP